MKEMGKFGLKVFLIILFLVSISKLLDLTGKTDSVSQFQDQLSRTRMLLNFHSEIETKEEKPICGDWKESKNIWILETKYPWARSRNLCTVESVARQMPEYCVR